MLFFSAYMYTSFPKVGYPVRLNRYLILTGVLKGPVKTLSSNPNSTLRQRQHSCTLRYDTLGLGEREVRYISDIVPDDARGRTVYSHFACCISHSMIWSCVYVHPWLCTGLHDDTSTVESTLSATCMSTFTTTPIRPFHLLLV